MRIIKINPKNPERVIIRQAARELKRGGVIVFPTDTAYGMGVDIFNRRAVRKLFKIKGRSKGKPLPVMVSSVKMAEKIAVLNKRAKEVSKKYWPGALTIVLPKKIPQRPPLKKGELEEDLVTDLITAGRSGVGVRIPDYKIVLALIKKLKKPITGTSANVSSQPSLYSAQEIYRIFKKRKFQPDLILDAGNLPRRKSSTIIDLSDKECKIIRKGPVRIKNL